MKGNNDEKQERQTNRKRRQEYMVDKRTAQAPRF